MPPSCARCAFLANGLFLDFVSGDTAPEALYHLPIVPGTDNSVRQCLACGQYYLYTAKYDSDIFQPTDSLDVQPVTSERVGEIILAENRLAHNAHLRLRRFQNQVRRKFRKPVSELSIIERFAFETILASGTDGMYLETLRQKLGYSIEDTITILRSLEQKQIVVRTIKSTPPWNPKPDAGWETHNLPYTSIYGNWLG